MSDERSAAERFESLNAYLAYLRARAPVGMHWYREIAPGLYRLERGDVRGGDPARERTFTRAELMRRFGFSR